MKKEKCGLQKGNDERHDGRTAERLARAERCETVGPEGNGGGGLQLAAEFAEEVEGLDGGHVVQVGGLEVAGDARFG